MPRTRVPVLGAWIDAMSWDETLGRIHAWSQTRESRYVCICNAHSVVTARHNLTFGRVIADADMATPDGAPVVWMMRRLGWRRQQRINGPDLMWRYCADAAERGEPMFLYGGKPSTLEALELRLKQQFPALVVAGRRSPPFRPLTAKEDAADIEAINASGAGVVWVSLGCPKQELWMAEHVGKISAVMIGVGAAFDFHAGVVARAPEWMRRNGLEWLHRLASEPRRLWRRYLMTNTLFIVGAVQQLTQGKTRR